MFPKAYNFFRRDYWLGQVDSRPLSIFRIVFGLVLLKHGLYHIPLARMYFSDAGIFPRWLIMNDPLYQKRFSLMDALPNEWMVVLFFSFWAVAALLLIVGFRTKLMSVLNFICILSVYERNPFLTNGADTIMRVMSLWSIFLSLGDYYSIDAVIKRWSRYRHSHNLADLRVEPEPHMSFAFPVRAVQVQVALIYVFTAILKWPGETWKGGTAVFWSLSLPMSTLPTGDFILRFAPAWLLTLLTYVTLFIETTFAFFVFVPVLQPYCRLAALALGTGLHAGIAFMMSVPNFLVIVVSYLVLFEARWVEWADQKLRATRTASTVAPALGRHPLLPFFALTKSAELSIAQVAPLEYAATDTWWIAGQREERWEGARAWVRLGGHLPLSRLWAWMLYSSWLRRVLWRLLIWSSGEATQPSKISVPAPAVSGGAVTRQGVQVRHLWLTATVLAVCTLLASAMWWNLRQVPNNGHSLVSVMPGWQSDLMWYSGLLQQWGVFAPDPRRYDNWWVIPGQFEDGSQLDLKNGKPFGPENKWDRGWWGPHARVKLYDDSVPNRPGMQRTWAEWLCREYNVTKALPPGKRLKSLQIGQWWQVLNDRGKPENPWNYNQLYSHVCPLT